ncbi:hypothetical protein ATANTOWER_004561 [Ataeniobius toweri]|uniref:Uncharacterized protein n=1 Tax=Ataeniobius toweri TaxID=208326 RepID=A0ABU7BGP3_9TELE|nr:hypothetical protein [Ataeniobius toweri]
MPHLETPGMQGLSDMKVVFIQEKILLLSLELHFMLTSFKISDAQGLFYLIVSSTCELFSEHRTIKGLCVPVCSRAGRLRHWFDCILCPFLILARIIKSATLILNDLLVK